MKKTVSLLLVLLLATSAVFATEAPRTLLQLIATAQANDLQAKIDQISVEKLEIEQFYAYRKGYNVAYTGSNKGEIVRVYTLNTVGPKRADNNLKHEKIQQLKHREELVVKVENAISDYVLAKQKLAVKQAEIAVKESKAKAVKLKLNLGLVIPLELIEAENEVADAKLSLIDVQNELSAKEIDIKKIVGLDLTTTFDIPYQLNIDERLEEDVVSNTASYVERDFNVIKAQDEYDVQLGLSDKIKETYKETVKEYKEAVLDLTLAENKLKDAKATARIDIIADYDQLQVHYKNYQLAVALKKIADKEHVNNQTKLKLGVISKLDLEASAQAVRDREFSVLSAINTYNKARRDYLLRLKIYNVDITPKDFDLNDLYYR